ncbi:MAG: hypothetical protein ACRDO7_08510 [Nocardioidaceae bacterium]
MQLNGHTRAALAAVALSVIAACSNASEETAADPFEPLPTVEYASGKVPLDRDADAVTAALTRIDPCALVDPKGAGVRTYAESRRPEADGPHVCEISNANYDDVRVTLGVELPATGGSLGGHDRFTRDLVTLGGAKAYVAEQDSTFCRVALPVSFTHAIEFVGSDMGVGADACAAATGFAAVAARRLERPGRVEQPRGPDRWSMCDLLGDAVGTLPKGTELRMGSDFLRGIDGCGVWQTHGEKLGMGGELLPVAAKVSLEIEYTSPEPEFDRFHGTVNGRRLDGYTSGGCVLAWNEWDAPGASAGPQVARLKVNAPTCGRGKKLVAQVTKVLDDRPPPSESAPQRPVLYDPDEPDVAAPAGCADLAEFATADCAAYAETDVPDGGVEVIRGAEADPNVNCALALDAVRAHFGERMRPVTAVHGAAADGSPAYACGFVEPSHATQVWIRASSEPMGQEPGSEIGGHPARDLTTAGEGMRQLWVALDGAQDRGHLYAEVLVRPDRSTGMFSDSPVDELPLRKLDELMTDLVDEHFD